MTYYKNGIISIPNVAGDIVITATAVQDAPENLFVKEPQETATSTPASEDKVYLGARLSSSGAAVFQANGQLVTRFIDAQQGDKIVLETDTATNVSTYIGALSTYKADNTRIDSIYHGTGSWSEDGKHGEFIVPSIGCAKVRLCIAYLDINNIKIYKQ